MIGVSTVDLRQISYILTIARTGNVTKAAEKIHISQSALSQAYRNLENELGLELFRKEGRNLTLTEDGVFFCEKGAELLNQAEEFRNLLEKRKSRRLQNLDYYTDVVDNCDETVLQYQYFFPDICFERVYGDAGEEIQLLKSGEVDFTLTLRRLEDPSLHSEMLIEEPVVMLVNRDFPLAGEASVRISQFDQEVLMIYQNAESLKKLFLEFFRRAGASPSKVVEVYDPVIQVQRNKGCIFMPESTYRSFKPRHMVGDCEGILIRDSFCRRRVFLTYVKRRKMNPVCRSFFEYLREYHYLSRIERCLPELERFEITGEYQLSSKKKGLQGMGDRCPAF